MCQSSVRVKVQYVNPGHEIQQLKLFLCAQNIFFSLRYRISVYESHADGTLKLLYFLLDSYSSLSFESNKENKNLKVHNLLLSAQSNITTVSHNYRQAYTYTPNKSEMKYTLLIRLSYIRNNLIATYSPLPRYLDNIRF